MSKFAIYLMIGLAYWAINVFIRKLPQKNESDEGWILAPVQVFLWPLFIFTIILAWTLKLFRSNKI